MPFSFGRSGAMGLNIIFSLFLLAGCVPRDQISEGVQLILAGGELGPATTFEIRFDEIAARPDEVGGRAEPGPLLFVPELRGQFQWLSQRSGVFTPDQPLALDTGYRLSLRPGLRQPGGQPLRAKLRRVLRTPPLQVTAWPREANANASAEPEVKLLFNASVPAAAASPYLMFLNAEGRAIPAEVWQGTRGERPWFYQLEGRGSLRTWREQFFAAQRRPSLPAATSDKSGGETNPVPNFLIAAPRQALPIGPGWRLVLSAGLPADEANLRLPARVEVPIGDVTPFIVEETTVHAFVSAGKEVRLRFSKSLASSLTESNAILRWLELTPEVENLTARGGGRSVTLHGNFKLRTRYKLTLRAGLPAAEPFKLEAPAEYDFTVTPLDPQLGFPAFANDQLADGSREFPLYVMNVEKIRVRAKLLDAHTLIHALRGYASHYASPERDESGERTRRLDYQLVPGRTIYTHDFAGTQQIDTSEKIILEWDRVLGGRKAGAVFVEAQAWGDRSDGKPRPVTQSLMQLTDLGMLWKRGQAQLHVFVFSHTTGKALPQVTVRLFSDENEALVEATTDATGLARLNVPTNAVWLVAELNGDIHALRLSDHAMPLHAFDLPIQWSDNPAPDRQVLLFSDRDVYRPGETLHLKAIARDWNEHGLAVPAKLTAKLQCFDARGKKFFETNAVFGELGSWHQSVPLPNTSRGEFYATLRLADRAFSHYFKVQDFQPAAFDIGLKPKPVYAADEKIEIPLSANYFLGKKLTRAKVRWSIEAEDREFKPAGFADFRFTRWQDYRSSHAPASFALTGEGMLNDRSNFVLAPNISFNPVVPQPRAVSLLTEITDINQQTISRSAEFICHASDFYLGLRLGAEVVTVGQAVPIEVVAVRADGQPWPQPVQAQVRLQRARWDIVRVQGAGRSVRYRSELNLSNIVDKLVAVAPFVLSTNTEDEIEGTEIAGLVPAEEGEYRIEVTAKDAGGRETVSSLSFGAITPPTNASPERLAWNYRDDVRIELKPDQESYQPGQTATLLVETPISGEALITVERERVLRTFRTRLAGNAPSVRVPLEAGDAPNVFASVAIVRGTADSPRQIKEPDYRVGYCQLNVENPRSRLTVAVQPASTNTLPGEVMSVTTVITDATGASVPDAEVTLWAVDEGILSLTEYNAPDPHEFFYQTRRLAVRSGVSLPNLLPEDPEQQEFHNKGYLIGGGGRDRVRKNFLACAFWHASLRTGSDGKVTARFTTPDSLTRYRILAIAHTAKNQFGRGESAFAISKPLMLEPALPRFANVTDRLRARAVVLNQTAQAGEVLVTLELDDKAASAGADLSRTVPIAPHGSATVEFPLTFTNTGPAKWTWRARFVNESRSTNHVSLGSFTDSVQSTLEVGHVAPLLTEIHLARTETAETNLLARANPQLLEGQGQITVVVANTRLSELSEAVSQLLHYPYGCAEQTSSSLLPWVVLRDSVATKFLHRPTAEIDQAIRAGVERLFTMQTSSGGFSYWPHGREPMLWVSAYGGLVLALAQRHGAVVPEEEFSKLLSYLSDHLRDSASASEPRQLAERCLALYALAVAGQAEAAYHEVMFQKCEKLSGEDRALLALAILEAHGPSAMVDELLKPASGPRAASDDWFGNGARETAVRLLAWTRHRPSDPLVDKLVAELMESQKRSHWTTTQGNAWALLALTEYATHVEQKLQPAAGSLTWGRQTVAFRLSETAGVSEHVFTLAPDLASSPLVLANSTKGRLFTQVKIESRSKVAQQPRQDRGFSLQRRYDRLDDQNQPQGLKDLRVGDRVLVTLNLSVRQPARYVAIDDALPSVLEALNPEFKTQQSRTGVPPVSNYLDAVNKLFVSFRELRTDRALFFADYVEPGDYTIRYLARVRAAGEVTAPPAKMEEMYHPERFGAAESTAVSTQAME